MSDYFKCDQCGKNFEKSGAAKFLSGASMGISNLGKHFCSPACTKAHERDNEKKDSKSTFSKEKEERIVIVEQKSEAQVQAELEQDRMRHKQELYEEKLAHERKMLEKQQKHELRMENVKNVSDAIENINNMDFGGENSTPESISNQIQFCLTLASSYLSEMFDVGGMKNILNKTSYSEEKEKLNQSEKVVNAAIKKAELGVKNLQLCEPQNKAINFYNIYTDQIKDVKLKHIERKWDHKILEAKPPGWVLGLCCIMVPFQLFVVYKLVELNVILPKKKNLELSQLK